MIKNKNKELIYKIKDNVKPRIDIYLKSILDTHSRSAISKLIEQGLIFVNNQPVKKKYRLQKNDIVTIKAQIIEKKEFVKKFDNDTFLDILYEDDYLLIISKPNNLSVHYESVDRENNLISYIYSYLNYDLAIFSDEIKHGLVHRLDKNTTGVIIFAKDEMTLIQMKKQFEERQVEKTYYSLCFGNQNKQLIKLTSYIGRSKKNANLQDTKNIINGKIAITYFNYLAYDKHSNISFVKCKPITGRTHQIRVHLKELNTPIINDFKYGNNETKKNEEFGQFLHSYKLIIIHPHTQQKIMIKADFPKEFYEYSLFKKEFQKLK